MKKRMLKAPSPALAVSLLALFVALGGTSYAAIKLPANSVGTKQLKNNAVTGAKIKNGAITAAKIDTSGLTVPNADSATSATSATNATNATHATSADSATNATHATSADSAASATNASELGGNPASSYVLAAPLQVIAPTLTNDWSAPDSSNPPRFAKDQFGIVHLFGLAYHSGSSSLPIFTLPAGYRPVADISEAVPFGSPPLATGVLTIFPDGTVFPQGGATGVELDGVTFVAG